MENALITLREKYADDLEEILQCPVCFERLSGPVPVCIQGHHVCFKCQPMMNECPFCKNVFNGTRNYLAESLISKFEEIKSSLIDPKHYSNKRVHQNKICIGTQTESVSTETNNNTNSEIEIKLPKNESSNNNQEISKEPPIIGKGKYPCRIGKCNEEHPHGRMIPHIRYYHSHNFIEGEKLINGIYSTSWKLQYIQPNRFDQAIHVQNMGLFFMNIKIEENGDFTGQLLMVNTALIAHQFNYTMEISNSSRATSYKGKVMGCRSKQKQEHCLFLDSIIMNYIMKNSKCLICKLTITRASETEIETSRKNYSLRNKTM